MSGIDQQTLIARQILDEILAEEKSWRETIQAGDWVDAAEDATYTFSGFRYKTKDKLYRIVDVRYVGDATGAIVSGDYLEESTGIYRSRVIIRDGKVIWRNSTQRHLMDKREAGEQVDEHLSKYFLDEERAMKEVYG